MKKYFLKFCLSIFLLLTWTSFSRAELREEFVDRKSTRIDEEALNFEVKSLEEEVTKKKQALKNFKTLSTLELGGSYETNARQLAIRKGDYSENVRYSFFYKRPLIANFLMTFNYNFDGTVYGEYGELTNILNHTRLSFDRPLNRIFNAGFGYDFSSFFYPSTPESDFYFHKFFFSLKNQFNKWLYQQVMFETGFKDYVHVGAYADSLASFQGKDRRDIRYGAEYNAGFALMEKLYFRFRTKYSINDSNARFEDYHDYNSLDLSPSLSYKISDQYSLNASLTTTKRNYNSRKTTAGDQARSDLIYMSNIGLRYNFNPNNTFNLGYGYTQSNSNDHASEYSGSSINWGWLHQF